MKRLKLFLTLVVFALVSNSFATTLENGETESVTINYSASVDKKLRLHINDGDGAGGAALALSETVAFGGLIAETPCLDAAGFPIALPIPSMTCAQAIIDGISKVQFDYPLHFEVESINADFILTFNRVSASVLDDNTLYPAILQFTDEIGDVVAWTWTFEHQFTADDHGASGEFYGVRLVFDLTGEFALSAMDETLMVDISAGTI